MRDVRYILPEVFDANFVKAQLGEDWRCPYCKAQSTSHDVESDTGWVETPLRRSKPQWICAGCCIDLYSASLSDSFAEHPYRDIVQQAADIEGVTLSEARRIIIEHQQAILRGRSSNTTKESRYSDVQEHIRTLLERIK
jgi:hypothetical protein